MSELSLNASGTDGGMGDDQAYATILFPTLSSHRIPPPDDSPLGQMNCSIHTLLTWRSALLTRPWCLPEQIISLSHIPGNTCLIYLPH